MSICELWVARCAAAAIDSGFDLDLLSFGEERTFFSRDYDASMVHSVSLTFDVDSITVAPSEDGNVHLSWYSRNPQKDDLSVADGILSLKTTRKSLISLNVRNYDAVLSLPANFDGDRLHLGFRPEAEPAGAGSDHGLDPAFEPERR